MEALAMQTHSPELSPRTHRQRENLPQKLSRGLHIHTNAHTIIMIINKIKLEKDKQGWGMAELVQCLPCKHEDSIFN